ncbi:Gamma-tubulin complex component 2 [Bienertia sinuspersici]
MGRVRFEKPPQMFAGRLDEIHAIDACSTSLVLFNVTKKPRTMSSNRVEVQWMTYGEVSNANACSSIGSTLQNYGIPKYSIGNSFVYLNRLRVQVQMLSGGATLEQGGQMPPT